MTNPFPSAMMFPPHAPPSLHPRLRHGHPALPRRIARLPQRRARRQPRRLLATGRSVGSTRSRRRPAGSEWHLRKCHARSAVGLSRPRHLRPLQWHVVPRPHRRRPSPRPRYRGFLSGSMGPHAGDSPRRHLQLQERQRFRHFPEQCRSRLHRRLAQWCPPILQCLA